ncbi:MAG: hypothetical protein MZU95_02045 [Desulfomicrobium escambiense]|nr:hypothetical protein [Desulfomicrobium escambiense]
MLAVMLGLTARLSLFAFAFGNPELAPLADRLPRTVPARRRRPWPSGSSSRP